MIASTGNQAAPSLALHLGAGLLQHPAADDRHLPAVFGNGDKVVGEKQASVGVQPAQQRLTADQLLSRQVTIGW